MSRKLSSCFALICLSVAPMLGQQAATTSEPATKEQILKFMDLMQLKSRMGQMMDGMQAQARIGAEQAFKQKVPHATAEQLAKVDAIADEMFSGFPVSELLDAIVPIYQKHLTKSDLDVIIGFYSSPTGQRFIQETPAMMSEAMQAGGEIGRRRMDEANRRIDERIAALAKEVSEQMPAPKTPAPK